MKLAIADGYFGTSNITLLKSGNQLDACAFKKSSLNGNSILHAKYMYIFFDANFVALFLHFRSITNLFDFGLYLTPPRPFRKKKKRKLKYLVLTSFNYVCPVSPYVEGIVVSCMWDIQISLPECFNDFSRLRLLLRSQYQLDFVDFLQL